jgi:hypothetical protein
VTFLEYLIFNCLIYLFTIPPLARDALETITTKMGLVVRILISYGSFQHIFLAFIGGPSEQILQLLSFTLTFLHEHKCPGFL